MQRTPTCRSCCRNYCFLAVPKQRTPNIPLLLECGHTFCESCITKLANLYKTQVLCPECSKPTLLTKEGEEGVRELSINSHIMGVLATNIYRKSLMESSTAPKNASKGKFKLTSKTGMQQAIVFITRQRKLEKNATAFGLKCEECFTAPAESRCLKCECIFCVRCFEKIHSSSHTLRKHKPLPLIKTNTCTNQESGCAEHEHRPFEFYDKDTEQPVCSHCVVVGGQQRLNVVPLSEIAESIKDHLKDRLAEGKSVLKHLENSQKKINQTLSLNQSEKNNLVNEVREHFQFLFASLQVRENVLINDVESCQSNEEALEMTVAEDIKKNRNLLLELEEALFVPSKLINRSKEFLADLDILKEMPCFAVKTARHDEEQSRFRFCKEHLDVIQQYGEVMAQGKCSLELKKLSEVSEEDKNHRSQGEEKETSSTEDESAGNDSDISTEGRRSLAARKLLTIPYRHELVQVTHIRDPSYFMVQRLADTEQLSVMMNAINKYCDASDASDLVLEVNIGDMVCAQFTGDNHWYRARVMSICSPSHPSTLPTIENGLVVQVMYIDFGNFEWIPMIRLRVMPAKFLHVPDVAICCSLVDIVPPFQQHEWPPKAIKVFGSLTGNKALLMTALRRGTGGIHYIDLKSPDDDEPTHDDDRPASVRDSLVFLEVARFKSAASQPPKQPFPVRAFKSPTPIENHRVPVLVTHATGPDDLYVQKLEGEEILNLVRVMQQMENIFSGKSRKQDLQVDLPYRGLVCSARFSEDRVWYRALVAGVNSDDTVDVHYVDYGNSERLPFTEIRKLPDSLLSLPRQALPAFLADLKPSDENTEWSDQARDFICQRLLSKSFLADVTGETDGKISIVLYDDTNNKEVSVNDTIFQSKLAIPAGLGIVQGILEEKPETTEDNNDEKSVVTPSEEKQADANEVEAELTPMRLAGHTTQHETHESLSKIQGDEVVPLNKSPTPPQRVLVQYKPALPPADKQFEAGITYVGIDGFIYAQEMKKGDFTLIKVMEKLNSYYSNGQNESSAPTSIQSLFVGQPCCACFSDDGMWYRAMVTKVMGQDKVEVNYIDFGNSEVVPLSALRMDNPDIEVPKQCLQLILCGVKPVKESGRWSKRAILTLSEIIVGKTCSAIVETEQIPGRPLEVRLCSPGGINVAEALLSQRLVRPTTGVGGMETRVYALPAGTRRGQRSKNKKKLSTRSETHLQAMLISAREADDMLPRTRLPEVGVTFDVTVTHVDQPDCFFIQRAPDFDDGDDDKYNIDPTLVEVEDELEKLEEMALYINKDGYFKNYEPLAHATKGMICCGMYSEDDMWYRGKVLAVESENPLKVLVRYFDYGNSEMLLKERLRGFPSTLLNLPIQATQCRLADVKPPRKSAGSSTEGSAWPAEAKDQFVEFVAGKRLTAKIINYESPPCVVLTECVPSEDGVEPSQVVIAQALAEKGLVIYGDGSQHDGSEDLSRETCSESAPSQSSCDVEVEETTSDDNDSSDDDEEEEEEEEAEQAEKERDEGANNYTTGREEAEYYQSDEESNAALSRDDSDSITEQIPPVVRLTQENNLSPDAKETKTKKDALLQKVLSAKVGFTPRATSPVPLLSPQQFALFKTFKAKDHDNTVSKVNEPESSNQGGAMRPDPPGVGQNGAKVDKKGRTLVNTNSNESSV